MGATSLQTRLICRLAGAVFALLIWQSAFQPVSAQVRWVKDPQQAKELASRQRRLILLHFWGDKCPPCEKMDRTVFNRPDVARAVHSRYIPVKLNVNQAAQLRHTYRVTSWPTDIIITPDGQEIRRAVGAREAHKYVSLLDETAARFSVANQSIANAPQGESTNLQTVQYNQPSGGQSSHGQPTMGQPQFGQPQFGQSRLGQPGMGQPMVGQHPTYPNGPMQDRGQNAFPGRPPQHGLTGNPAQEPRSPSSPAGRSGSSRWSPTTANPSVVTNPNIPPSRGGGFSPRGGGFKPQPSDAQPTAPYRPGSLGRNDGQMNLGGNLKRGGSPSFNSAASRSAPPPPFANNASVPNQGRPPASVAQNNPFIKEQRRPPYGPPSAPGSNGPAKRSPQGHPPIGLDGYCPVALIEKRDWNPGDARFGAIHRGRTYLFSGPEEQRRFLENPDRYGPVLLGYDPVKFVEERRFVEGNRKFGLFLGGQIYLFADPGSREKFERNPENYAKVAYQAMLQGAAQTKLR